MFILSGGLFIFFEPRRLPFANQVGGVVNDLGQSTGQSTRSDVRVCVWLVRL